jgi:hypothetical protein
MRPIRAFVAATVIAAAAIGCRGWFATQIVPVEMLQDEFAGLSPLAVSNDTTLEIVVFVNDVEVSRVPPDRYVDPVASMLPRPPWRVEARTMSGRVLISFEVLPGGAGRDGNGIHGAGSRVDLSCGRLDVWAGPPMVGPMPGPGQPADCDP